MYKFAAATLFVAVAATTPSMAGAQMQHDHSMMKQSAPSQPAKSAAAEGEVRKIDRSTGTVTLKHGPLEALNMPPMTMVFVAKDAKLLNNVKEGDKVRFTPEQAKDGTLIVTTLEVVKS
jgi:Cu(I)/Ag(I) efflux system periplasmic protein CusF